MELARPIDCRNWDGDGMLTKEWRKHPVYNYEVSSEGDVRHAETGRVRKLHPDRDGYMRFNAKLPGRKAVVPLKVAVLVCETFHGPRPFGDAMVLHGPLGKSSDAASNLRWGTHSQNMLDRRRDGTSSLGIKKMTTEKRVDIRRMITEGYSQICVARIFGVSPSTVRYVLRVE